MTKHFAAAGIVAAAGALRYNPPRGADGIRVTTPEGKGIRSTTLDLSVLGNDGKSIELKANTDSR